MRRNQFALWAIVQIYFVLAKYSETFLVGQESQSTPSPALSLNGFPEIEGLQVSMTSTIVEEPTWSWGLGK